MSLHVFQSKRSIILTSNTPYKFMSGNSIFFEHCKPLPTKLWSQSWPNTTTLSDTTTMANFTLLTSLMVLSLFKDYIHPTYDPLVILFMLSMRPESPAKTRTKNQKAQSPKKTEKARTVRTLIQIQAEVTEWNAFNISASYLNWSELIMNINMCILSYFHFWR